MLNTGSFLHVPHTEVDQEKDMAALAVSMFLWRPRSYLKVVSQSYEILTSILRCGRKIEASKASIFLPSLGLATGSSIPSAAPGTTLTLPGRQRTDELNGYQAKDASHPHYLVPKGNVVHRRKRRDTSSTWWS